MPIKITEIPMERAKMPPRVGIVRDAAYDMILEPYPAG